MGRLLALLALGLLGCRSSKPYAPSEVGLEVGHRWFTTEGAPSLDHEGPGVALTLSWDIGPRAESYRRLEALDGRLGALVKVDREVLETLTASHDLQLAEAVAGGTVVVGGPQPPPEPSWEEVVLDFATDPRQALGLILVAVAYLLLGLGRKYLGLPIPIPGFKKKA